MEVKAFSMCTRTALVEDQVFKLYWLLEPNAHTNQQIYLRVLAQYLLQILLDSRRFSEKIVNEHTHKKKRGGLLVIWIRFKQTPSS